MASGAPFFETGLFELANPSQACGFCPVVGVPLPIANHRLRREGDVASKCSFSRSFVGNWNHNRCFIYICQPGQATAAMGKRR
jgi:hypothetical protein